jgi:hypothetical protein
VPKKGPPPPPGVDLGDPLKVVRAYGEGLRDGDEAKLRSVFLTAGKEWDTSIDTLARWAKGSARLERAAVKKFGRAGADKVMGALYLPSAGKLGRDLLGSLGDAQVKVRGDRATVDVPVVDELELRRVDGRWGLFTPPDPDEPAGARGDGADLYKVVTAAQERVAPAVEAGRLATPEAAVAALNRAAGEESKKLGIGEEDDEEDNGR